MIAGVKAWFTLYAHGHAQAPAQAQILFNAFVPKHSHRVGTLNAHNQIKRYFARLNELECQREQTVWITFSSQSLSNNCRERLFSFNPMYNEQNI